MARRAIPAGGNRAAAALVPVQPRQGVVLVAHGDGAAVGADHTETARSQPGQYPYPRTVRQATRAGEALLPLALAVEPRAVRGRGGRAAPGTPDSETRTAARTEACRSMDPRPPQRRRWPRRDLSGDGERLRGTRAAGLPGRASRAPRNPQGHR